MKTFHILAFDLGEFIATNPMFFLTAVALILGAIAGYIRLEYLAKITREDLDEVMDDLDKHTKNSDAHVNQLYIGTLKDRITNVETGLTAFRKDMADEFKSVRSDIQNGHEKLGDKMDAMIRMGSKTGR